MMGNMVENNKAFRFAKGLVDTSLMGPPHIMPVTCKKNDQVIDCIRFLRPVLSSPPE